MMRFTIILPWPDAGLFQNSRMHWGQKARKTSTARHAAAALTREAIGRETGHSPYQSLVFEFYPPDKRRRDIQNMPEAMKASIDGIADALGVDDHKFQPDYPTVFCEPRTGGKVVVHVRPIQVEFEGKKIDLVGDVS